MLPSTHFQIKFIPINEAHNLKSEQQMQPNPITQSEQQFHRSSPTLKQTRNHSDPQPVHYLRLIQHILSIVVAGSYCTLWEAERSELATLFWQAVAPHSGGCLTTLRRIEGKRQRIGMAIAIDKRPPWRRAATNDAHNQNSSSRPLQFNLKGLGSPEKLVRDLKS